MRVENCTIIGAAVAALLFVPACSRKPAQTKFATSEDASAALLQALKTNDKHQLGAIFGADAVAAVASGDAVSDRNDREVVALAMEQ